MFTPGTTKGTVTLQKGHFKLALNDQKGHCKHALRDQKGHIYCLCSPPPPTPTHQRDSYFPLYLLSLLPSQSNIPSFVPNLQKWMSLLKNCSPALNDLMFPVHLYGLCSSQNLTFILCSHFSKKMSLFPPKPLGLSKGNKCYCKINIFKGGKLIKKMKITLFMQKYDFFFNTIKTKFTYKALTYHFKYI